MTSLSTADITCKQNVCTNMSTYQHKRRERRDWGHRNSNEKENVVDSFHGFVLAKKQQLGWLLIKSIRRWTETTSNREKLS